MRLTQIERNDIPDCFKQTKLLRFLNEFIDSGMQCARVDDHSYTSAGSGAGAFNNSAKRFGLSGGVKAISRNGEIYLIRKDEK